MAANRAAAAGSPSTVTWPSAIASVMVVRWPAMAETTLRVVRTTTSAGVGLGPVRTDRRPVADAEAGHAVVDVELVDAVGVGRHGVATGGQKAKGPLGAKGLAVDVGVVHLMTRTPHRQRDHRFGELAARVGELVEHGRTRLIKGQPTLNDAVGLQLPHPGRQQARSDAGQCVGELHVPLRTGPQFPHDQQRPPFPDHVEGMSQAAELAVVPSRHDLIVPITARNDVNFINMVRTSKSYVTFDLRAPTDTFTR